MKFQTVLASAGRRDHPLLPPLGVVGTMGPIAAPPRAAGSVSSGAGAGEEGPGFLAQWDWWGLFSDRYLGIFEGKVFVSGGLDGLRRGLGQAGF